MDSNFELKTPNFSHLTSADFEHVYEPAEDTFLLVDSLQEDANFISNLKPSICVEVGSGSGVVITALNSLLTDSPICFATDRNPHAADCTQRTAKQNGCHVEVLACDLLTPLMKRLQGAVDVLIFNPPYVVTPSEEIKSNGIEASWAGGVKGREVTDRLLPVVSDLLSPSGVMYLVTIRENQPKDMMRWMAEMGLQSKVVLERQSGPEHLSVIRFYRAQSVT